MSYIFSANGNAYTFKKLDSMLVNIPTDADSNGSVLVRKTVDNIPEYSWVRGETYVIKTNKAIVKSFTPESNITISRGNSFKTSFFFVIFLLNNFITNCTWLSNEAADNTVSFTRPSIITSAEVTPTLIKF